MLRVALIAALLMPTVLSAAPELKGDPAELASYLLDEKRVVSLTASGDVKVQADRATVALRVKTKDSAFAQALKLNRDVRAKLGQQLQQAGISPDRITAAKFSSVPNYGFFGDKPSSYEISNDVSVVVRGEDDMAVIAHVVDGMKEASYLAVQFEDSNKKAHEADALNDALANIARKKSAYEKALSFTLVPLRVADTSFQQLKQQMAPAMVDPGRQAFAERSADPSQMRMQSSAAMAVEEGSGDGGSGFGELRYQSNVQVDYLVQSR